MSTPATLEAINGLTDDIAQLWLAPQAPYHWQAGDYLLIELADEKRPFSIANAPNPAGRIELHIRHTHDDWYNRLFQHTAGATLQLSAPQQQYPPPQGDHPVLFVAGGTGFAPFKAHLEVMLQNGFAQPIRFYWGARSQADLYQDDLMRTWAANHPGLTYIPVLSEETWPGRCGLVADAVLEDMDTLSAWEVYLCGPWPMVEDARRRFTAQGASLIH